MTVPEIVAVATGILSVWFARNESILVYPIGIISVLLYVYICFNVKLYADSAINFYYFIVSIYGWYYWRKGGRLQNQNKQQIKKEIDSVCIGEGKLNAVDEAEITSNSFIQNLYYLFITVALGILLGYLLNNFTDSDVPWWDGFTTAIFFVAMLLMAQRKSRTGYSGL